MRQKSTYCMLIWALTLLLVSTLSLGGCSAFPTAVATPTPTPTVNTDATVSAATTVLASLPTLPPETPTLYPPVSMAGWHVIFQQQGTALAGVTIHKLLGSITVSQNFFLEVACIGSGSAQAQLDSMGYLSGLCPRDSGAAEEMQVPPASYTRYSVDIKIQGPVQWAVMVEEKD
jgi:hypothetical protein